MSQSGGKTSKADIAREYMLAHAQQVAAQAPEPDSQPVLIVTTNEIPGYQITGVQGDVFGLVVRARNYFSNLGAQFMTIAGGEVAGYTRLLTDSRNEAREPKRTRRQQPPGYDGMTGGSAHRCG